MTPNPFIMKKARRLYKGTGILPITHDYVFKKTVTQVPGFAENLMYAALSMRQGSILEVEDRNTELIPDNYRLKAFQLDALFSIKVRADNGEVLSHLVNMEAHHSPMQHTLKKCLAYGGRIIEQQVPRGTREYGGVNSVYTIVILKHNLPEFKTTDLYHHYHEHHNVWDPESRIFIPGNKFAFIELGKLAKEFHELKTFQDYLFYFLKKLDRVSMPLEEVEFYLKMGGVVARALEQAIEISDSAREQDLVSEVNRIRENYVIAIKNLPEVAIRQAKEEGELKGMEKGWLKGKAAGKAEGKAEGIAETLKEFVLKLIADDFKHDKIAQLTGLSVDEVKEISLAHGVDHS